MRPRPLLSLLPVSAVARRCCFHVRSVVVEARLVRRCWPVLLVAFATPAAAQQPPPEVRQSMLESCRVEILKDVGIDGREEAFAGPVDVTLFDDQASFVQDKKDRLKIDGRGEVRYGPDFLFQPMTFSCEWDLEKEKLRKGSYKLAKGADMAALPPAKAAAVDACQRDVRERFRRMASDRDYYSPTLNVSRGVRFEQTQEGVAIYGQAGYKLHYLQDKEVVHEYRCAWDAERRELLGVETRPKDAFAREIGSITCESRDMNEKSCSAPVGGRVRVRSNLSKTRCSEFVNWRVGRDEIVVRDGCRATFEFEMR